MLQTPPSDYTISPGFLIDGLANFPPDDQPLHLAIGMFDGLHRGHQKVFAAALGSRQAGGKAGVLTFHPHPSHLFHPESPTPQIYPPQVKSRLLARRGFDLTIVEPFSPELASLAPADFWQYLRSALPGLRTVCVGTNFRFGHRRAGSAPDLQALARQDGLDGLVLARLEADGAAISSSRIRSLLPSAPISAINALLGYPYTTFSHLAPGKKLGRTLGFPTLNFPWSPEIHPPFGVYQVQLRFAGMPRFLPGIANYGLRPTLDSGDSTPLLEVHLLDPFQSTAGHTLAEVQWLEFQRPEQRFPTVEALREAIARDVQWARQAFAKTECPTT